MTQMVNMTDEVYQKLKFFKEKQKHKSFGKAITELLRVYWNPDMSGIQIQEKFSELQAFLIARDLSNDRVMEAIQITQARVLQLKKERVREHKIQQDKPKGLFPPEEKEIT